MLLLAVLLLPFMSIAFYCHPSADDFAYAWSSKQIGLLASCERDYLNWNGRYFSNVLVFLNPISFNQFKLYQLVPLLLIFGTFTAVYLFLDELFQTLLIRVQKWMLSLLFLLLFLVQMPQLAQGIYWYTGAITYQSAAILLLFYLRLFIRYTKAKFFYSAWMHLFLMGLLLICIVGCNEVGMLYLLFFHLILFLKSKGKGMKGLSILILLASLFVFFSPGNAGRGAHFQNAHQFWHSFGYSVLQTLRFFFTWVSSYPFFLSSLLFLPFAGYLLTKEPIKKWNFNIKPIESFVILVTLIFLAVFPAYWGMGILGQHRTLNFACFFFCLFWFFNLFLWIRKLAHHPTIARLNQFVVKYKMGIFALLVISFFLRGNLLLVSQDILQGKASGYDREMEIRYAKIKDCSANKEQSCVVDSLHYKPESIFNFDISNDENYWINKGEAAYFGLSKIKTSARKFGN